MIALISDIHGNYPALQAVLREIDKLGCDEVISLGDVAGYYCMFNECAQELRARRIVNLLGNHDNYLLSGKGCPRSQSASKCLVFQAQSLKEEHRQWLSQSPVSLTRPGVSMVHGGWDDPIDEYLYELRADYFAGRSGRYFFSGHTHVQILAELGGKTYCNPGAVGQPRDGDGRAAFALWDGAQIRLRRVEYDIDWICREMHRAGFEPGYYENLSKGTRIGGAISTVRVCEQSLVQPTLS